MTSKTVIHAAGGDDAEYQAHLQAQIEPLDRWIAGAQPSNRPEYRRAVARKQLLQRELEISQERERRKRMPGEAPCALRTVPHFTQREQRLRTIIERGSRGIQYCRELDNERIRPRRKWIDNGCPAKYPAAYLDKVWRQRINDEKSKIAKKLKSIR